MLPGAFADAAVAIPGWTAADGDEGEGGRRSGSGSGTEEEEEEEEEEERVMRGVRTRSGGRPRRCETGVYLYGIGEK